MYSWPTPEGKRIRRKLKLGEFPAVGIADARRKLQHAKELIDKGNDPAVWTMEQTQARLSALDVHQLIDRFVAHKKANGLRSVREYERVLRKDIEPDWGGRKAKDIVRGDVAAMLEKIADRGAGVGANRTGAIIRSMFTYALKESIVETNPAQVFNAKAPEEPRQRSLSSDELGRFWIRLDDIAASTTVRLALKWALVTGQRRAEVVKARHALIDEGTKIWTIPAEDAKNKRTHLVPLSPMALDLYAEIKKLSGDGAWLFPSPRKKLAHIAPAALTHAVANGQQVLKVENVWVHDLRRTVATGMGALGVQDHIRERILNHAQDRLSSTYNVYGYIDEKRVALNKWANHLQAAIRDQPQETSDDRMDT